MPYLARLGRRAFGVGCSVRCARYSVATAIAICMASPLPAAAQKHGGTLNVYISANPSSLSILEEVSFTTVMAAGPVGPSCDLGCAKALRGTTASLSPPR